MNFARKAAVSIAILAAAVTPLAAGQISPALAQGRQASSPITVGLAIIGGVNDKGFNQLADLGLRNAKKHLGVKISETVTAQNGDYNAALQGFVNQHDALIIAVGALWGTAVHDIASANPKLHFAIVDGYPTNSQFKKEPLPNVASLFFKSEQSGYIVGVIAGLMEKEKIGAAKNNTIAALGALPLPFITGQMCGYWQGAKSVDKHVKFYDTFVNNFFDPVTAKADGQKQIQKDHADILFGVADESGLGYYQAAAEAHKYAIGFASDQDGLGSYMLTSAEVGIQVAVYRTIQAQVEHKFKPYAHTFSLKNGGISYATNMHHVPGSIKSYAAGVASKLASGKLVANPNCTLPNNS